MEYVVQENCAFISYFTFKFRFKKINLLFIKHHEIQYLICSWFCFILSLNVYVTALYDLPRVIDNKSMNLLIETHAFDQWRELTIPQRNATLDNLEVDSMDITRFFLVSFHWLVGVPMVILSENYELFFGLTITDSEFCSSEIIYIVNFSWSLQWQFSVE